MTGICPQCGNSQSVHRASWTGGRIPKCRLCGSALRPDESSKRTVASRKSEARKGIVSAIQDELDRR